MSTALITTAPDQQTPESLGGFALARYITEQAKPLAYLAELYVKGGLVPSAILKSHNPVGAAFTILTTGMELGLPPATALRSIHVIEGRATLSADTMAGLAIQAGVAFEYLQSDNSGCKIRWRRGASSGVVSFGIDDAKAAGLSGKDNWRKYPAAMMAARAKAAAARQAAPDRLAGCYTPDEILPGGGSVPAPDVPYTEMPAAAQAPPPVAVVGGGEERRDPAGVDGPSSPPPPAASGSTDDPMQNSTRQRLMGLAKALGCTGTAELEQPNGSTRTSTTIVLDEAMAARIARPGAPWVPLISLTNKEGQALIAELEERRTLEDAGAATGNAQG